jgi:putative two-component system response regulator
MSKQPTILVVDDELINIKILAEVLKGDYHVVFATSGQEAVRLAGELKPDVILLDVVMPDLDGYSVCERLRQDPATAAIPVIFVTVQDTVEQEVRGLEAGAIDYVTKPVRPSAVKARVQQQLAYRSALLAAAQAEPAAPDTVPVAVPEEAPPAPALSSRQQEIFAWVQAGKTNWEIARILGCSEDNVKYHMKKILRVFGLNNRTHAAAQSVRAGLPGMR